MNSFKKKFICSLILCEVIALKSFCVSLEQRQNEFIASSVDKINSEKTECETNIPVVKEESLESEMICKETADLDPDKYSFFKFRYHHFKDCPSFIRNQLPGTNIEGVGNRAFTLEIALPNDNKLLGLWGILLDDGDDFGNTHGTKVKASKNLKSGQRVQISGATNVYTRAISRHRRDNSEKSFVEQNFTNKNVVKMLMDNIGQRRSSYYKAGVGWVNLDSENWKSHLLASGQQHSWHKFLTDINSDLAIMPVPVPDGKGSRHGFTIEAFLGAQKNLINKKSSCRLNIYTEVGGEYNNLGGSSFQGKAGATFYFQNPNSNWSFSIGSKAAGQIHEYGSQFQTGVDIGIQKNRTIMSFEYHQRYGHLMNDVNYNDKNRDGSIDSTMSIKIGIILGSWKNNS